MGLLEYSEVYDPVYHDLIDITMKHERSHWTEDEIKLQTDIEQWNTGKISDKDKHIIKNILLLFTQSDVNVGQGYYDVLIPYIKNNEARNMLGSFAAREGIHQRGYALYTDTLGYDKTFYSQFLDIQVMREKHEFMIERKGNGHKDFAQYLAKQLLCEGVSLFAMFAILLNYDRQGILPGMCDLNRWSFTDESIHIEGNSALFRHFLDEHPRIVNDEFKQEIYSCARTLVDLEDRFIDRVFGMGGAKDLTAEQVKEYIRYVTDYRLTQLGLKPNWGIKQNPLEWIDWIMGNQFGNFFERTIVDYSKANLTGEFKNGY